MKRPKVIVKAQQFCLGGQQRLRGGREVCRGLCGCVRGGAGRMR